MDQKTALLALSVLLPDLKMPTPDNTHAFETPLFQKLCKKKGGPPSPPEAPPTISGSHHPPLFFDGISHELGMLKDALMYPYIIDPTKWKQADFRPKASPAFIEG